MSDIKHEGKKEEEEQLDTAKETRQSWRSSFKSGDDWTCREYT
jgi:hypothetical protein